MQMRLGIFGGSFDPIHYGHLLLAETALEQCRLDSVWFIPAAVPPHKQQRILSPAGDRIEMLKLAIAGHHWLEVAAIEIDRGGVSFTVETLEEIGRQHPEAELFFLMGADSLKEMPTWRDPHRICELAVPIVVRRLGAPEPDFRVISSLVSEGRLQEIRQHQVEMPIIDLSSTDIRCRVSQQRSIRFRTPRSVEKYIETHKLYCNESETPH